MKVVLYNGITINGFLAKEDDDTSWISKEDSEGWVKFCQEHGNTILGRHTFDLMKESGEILPGVLHIILTSNKGLTSDNPKVVYVYTPQQALDVCQEKGFEVAVVSGGGFVNASFLEEKLVDEVYLDLEPRAFNSGKPIFNGGKFDVELELLELSKLSPNVLHLHYKVKK